MYILITNFFVLLGIREALALPYIYYIAASVSGLKIKRPRLTRALFYINKSPRGSLTFFVFFCRTLNYSSICSFYVVAWLCTYVYVYVCVCIRIVHLDNYNECSSCNAFVSHYAPQFWWYQYAETRELLNGRNCSLSLRVFCSIALDGFFFFVLHRHIRRSYLNFITDVFRRCTYLRKIHALG